jgi:hypothetical protein
MCKFTPEYLEGGASTVAIAGKQEFVDLRAVQMLRRVYNG